MDNGGEGFSTRELSMAYFGFADLENMLWVGDQLQAVRLMLQDRPTPLLLRNQHHRWYVVQPTDSGGARGFILDRAKRFVRSHRRLERYSEIGQSTYSLPAGDPLLVAIEAAQTRVQEVAAVALPEPDEED